MNLIFCLVCTGFLQATQAVKIELDFSNWEFQSSSTDQQGESQIKIKFLVLH